MKMKYKIITSNTFIAHTVPNRVMHILQIYPRLHDFLLNMAVATIKKLQLNYRNDQKSNPEIVMLRGTEQCIQQDFSWLRSWTVPECQIGIHRCIISWYLNKHDIKQGKKRKRCFFVTINASRLSGRQQLAMGGEYMNQTDTRMKTKIL